MTTTTVTTQAELDAAIAAKSDVVYINSPSGVWLNLYKSDSSHVVASGSSRVEAWGSSRVVARDSSRVEASGSSRVEARDSSHVVASGSSHVVASDSSRVVASGSSRVEARDSSHVVAWGSSRVEARDSSRVVAWGSSRVVAWGSSRVVAWGSSHVVASGSSHVVASGSSRVEASKYVAVHLHSARADITGGVLIDLTKIDLNDATQWLEFHGVHVENGVAYVYKAVNDEWTTDRGVDYSPGSTPGAPDWKPTLECGNGLHFGATPLCSREYFREATKYVRVGVAAETLVPLGDKCKAPKVVVAAVEVDMYGHEVQPS
jgi:hypothetical protein